VSFNAVKFLEDLYRPATGIQALPAYHLRPAITGPEGLPMDWRIAWEERAAVREYHGGLERERAEALAFSEILEQMNREATDARR